MKILKILFVLIFVFVYSFNTFAATADLQVMAGSWQEVLILGEVCSKIDNDVWLVKVNFVFPQTKKLFVFKNMKIIVNGLEKHWLKSTGESTDDITIGEKYFLSLSESKDVKGYDVMYSPIKVNGDNYWDVDVVNEIDKQNKILVEHREPGLAVWQIFINSGGKERMHSFNFNKDGDVYWKGNKIYPEDLYSKQCLDELRQKELKNVKNIKAINTTSGFLLFSILILMFKRKIQINK